MTGVCLDSRRTRPGDLYAALPGERVHGARFVDQARQGGAVAVLTDRQGLDLARQAATAGDPDVAVLVAEDPRAVLGGISAQVYGDPSAALRVVGVTGTNGKTTTTFLVESGFAAYGQRTAVLGTTGVRLRTETGIEVLPAARTTPEAPELAGVLAAMVERGIRSVAMEVSSHALALHRIDGTHVDVAVFTNLGRDHLDFHHDMQTYFAAKARLFTRGLSRAAVVNLDDPHGRRLATLAAAEGLEVHTYSSEGSAEGSPEGRPLADWWVVDRQVTDAGQHVLVRGPGQVSVELVVALPGVYNVANALAALVALVAAGVPVAVAATGIRGCTAVPGRLELVSQPGDPARVYVDYAHTPDAVRALLTAVRPMTPRRLVVVLGAGGDRDRDKRPTMGAAAARGADLVVVTDDNPRGEDPASIRTGLLAGARQVPAAARGELLEVPERRTAIRRAVALAGPGDVVLIVGKGHEQGQEIAGRIHLFDDRDEARAALREVRG